MAVAVAVAHRGDPYVARENTLPSVRSALLKGADAVEVDVRVTWDDEPVLLHDATLERLWGHDEEIAHLTLREVRKLTGGGVPTLADAFAELRRHERGRMLLDLTGSRHAALILEVAEEAGVRDRIYFCGQLPAMAAVREADPDAEIALTWTTSVRPAESLLDGVRPRWINLRFGLVDEATVRWARERELLVGAWTADWQRNMTRLLALGTDAVTTNRLDTLQRLLARRR
jgi:glycerophosphoryl diester phosphodiesterase